MTSPAIEPTAEVAAPAEDAERSGLRERKKAKTRATIRDQALRLFQTQGFHATTVEQIAAAAEISPATFFRYFPTKESVVLEGGFELVSVSAFESQPPELGPVAAYRAAAAATFAATTPADQARFTENAQIVLDLPEVRARFVDKLARTVDSLAAVIARRAGRPEPDADDITTRSIAGAITGVVIAAALPWHEAVRSGDEGADMRSMFERIDAGLRCLEVGLPLVLGPGRTPDGDSSGPATTQ